MSQLHSLLLVMNESEQLDAIARHLAVVRPDWEVRTVFSVKMAKVALLESRFDVAVVAAYLADGLAADLADALASTPAVLCFASPDNNDVSQGACQGFVDHFIFDAEGYQAMALPVRLECVYNSALRAQELHKSQSQLQLALTQSSVAPWYRHLRSGRVAGNTSAIQLLGYAFDEVRWDAEWWQSLVHPDDSSAIKKAIEDYLAGKTQFYECEYRIRHKNGHWIWVLSRGNTVEHDDDGRAIALAGVFMDITERRRSQETASSQHRLIKAISRAQGTFINSTETAEAFDGLLTDLLELTGSAFGFMGEVLYANPQQPYLLVYACTDIAWSEASRAAYAKKASQRLEFNDLKTLFGAALLTRTPVIANDPIHDVRAGGLLAGHPPLSAFMGIPIEHRDTLVAFVGLANNPAGYSSETVTFLQPLCQSIGQLVYARRAEAARINAVQALQTTLDSMSEGILTMDGQSKISVYNKRLLELLELPESMMVDGVTGADVVRYQRERGDFVKGLKTTDPAARTKLEVDDLMSLPERYVRKTPSGLTLEIKTQNLPAGGIVRTFSDVTHFVKSQEALKESETRFRSLTELSADWYWEQDAQFKFTRVDGKSQSRSAMLNNDYFGRTRWDSGAAGVSRQSWEDHRLSLEAHELFHNFEMQRRGPDGRLRWVSISGMPIFDDSGVFVGYRGIGRDISAQKLAADETFKLAFFDTLTGLPNRRLLLDRLALALANSARSHQFGALFFIDLDNFKDLNDTLGHDVGDRLLEQVAERLTQCVREGDTVARFGGDEFVVMLERLGDSVDDVLVRTKTLGEKVLSSLNQPYSLVGREHYSTPSIGVAMFSDQLQEIDELLKRADLAMYQAKAVGRNTLRFFDPEMQELVAKRAQMVDDLRESVRGSELLLHYQGVFDTEGLLVGVEALLRWQHPVRGMVMPLDFIGLAEQTGLILPIGNWVLRTACDQLALWADQPGRSKLTIAINVSARQIRQPDFVAQVLWLIEQSGANPNLLKIELTESMLLNDVEDSIGKMHALKVKGIGFSLDDFGTGYSSLSYLKRLPLDQLKIDKSFVRDVLTDPNDAAIAKTVIALASSLGLAVVAEGVETQGQLAFLKAHGCQMFQGYLFGKPVAASEIEATGAA